MRESISEIQSRNPGKRNW